VVGYSHNICYWNYAYGTWHGQQTLWFKVCVWCVCVSVCVCVRVIQFVSQTKRIIRNIKQVQCFDFFWSKPQKKSEMEKMFLFQRENFMHNPWSCRCLLTVAAAAVCSARKYVILWAICSQDDFVKVFTPFLLLLLLLLQFSFRFPFRFPFAQQPRPVCILSVVVFKLIGFLHNFLLNIFSVIENNNHKWKSCCKSKGYSICNFPLRCLDFRFFDCKLTFFAYSAQLRGRRSSQMLCK